LDSRGSYHTLGPLFDADAKMTAPSASYSAAAALKRHAHLPLVLLGVLTLICVATLWRPPAGRTSWFLEVTPGLLMVLALGVVYRRMPLSHWVYAGVFCHVLILIYGGYYTYALTPLGNWAKDAFHLSRNHYDRIGHVALGVFPAFMTREILLRRTPLGRGGWLAFLTVCVVFAFAAFWELLEWWTTLIVASDTGSAFLGSQGDVWDAQWDMFLALLGAIAALLIGSRAHDRSIARVPFPRT
jgi:putative membrane protein